MKGSWSSIIIVAGLLLTACGGGGSGGEGSQTFTETIYVGLETQAEIDQTNARTMVEGMFGTQDFRLQPVDANGDPVTIPYNILVPRALIQTIRDINANAAAASSLAERFLIEEFNCDSGLLDYQIDVDDVTGTMNGTMTFRDCLSLGITFKGQADVSGTYDLIANQFTLINLSFVALSATDAFMDYNATGVIQFESGEFSATITLNDYDVGFPSTSIAYKFDDFIITISDTDPAEMTLSGRFYHPEWGFMLVETVINLLIAEADVMPHAGQFTADGSGSALRVTSLDGDSYLLELDLDITTTGYDTSEVLSW